MADGQDLPDRWDVATGTGLQWKRPIPGLAHSSPIIWGNRIFDGFDLVTGEERFGGRIPQRGSGFSASPVAGDGKLFLAGEDGEVFVAEAGATLQLASTNSMGEALMATPAISQGRLYVRGQRHLFAIGR